MLEQSDNLAANTAPSVSEIYRRARLSRDARFDGEFYVAVHSTGIYCRPICPARAPAEKNVRYFPSAALAAQAGFRPCLRCRPESAPDSPAWLGTSTTVQRAVQLIGQGALNTGSLGDLALRLGIGERYLRKLFQRELGVSPQALALNLRLLFAKKLLAETRLPMTDVAFAAGFGSVRRFNSAVLQQFRLPPGALRRHQRRATTNASITLQLHYRPPYDWESAIAVYARHAVPGVESVQDAHYRRNFKLGGAHGSFTVRPLTGRNALQLDLNLSDHSQLMPVVARIRRMFDLDANPAAVDQVLRQDPNLAPLLQQRPGIRCIGHWSLYEAAVRGIAGQQISTQAARKVLATLTTRATQRGSTPTFPGAAALLALPDDAFPMPGRRRDTLRALAQLVTTGEDNLTIETLSALRGVGPWTVAVASLRGSGDPDAWPARDLGLEKAWANLGGHTSTLHDYAARWRPWRGYAANLLWRSLNL